MTSGIIALPYDRNQRNCSQVFVFFFWGEGGSNRDVEFTSLTVFGEEHLVVANERSKNPTRPL